jgi:hypothetical protein
MNLRDYRLTVFRTALLNQPLSHLQPSLLSSQPSRADMVLIHGIATGYLSAPAIYLTRARQVTNANP